ncbi:MAG: gliding motility-associated C-terminal domain-containing protein [Carboxylicivirga sp.]|jgi:gliding motility-associated-like protein|nr:gliding motility-associated C-terminal domain-containing protein [Carboxylicivirga sp.]
MKKYLLGITLLLIWTGVDKIYGQKPTAIVTFDDLSFCESEKVGGVVETQMRIDFTGSGIYDFDYYVNYRADDDYDKKVEVRRHNGDLFNTPINLFQTSTISIFKIYDDNYPLGGEGSDDITMDNNTIVVDQIPTPIINDPIRTCDLDVHLSASKEFPSSTVLWRLENAGDGLLSDETIVDPVFSANTDGVYNVYLKEIQGECETEVSAPVSAVNKPSPTGGPIENSEVICSGNAATIELGLYGTFPITVFYEEGNDSFNESDPYEITTPSYNTPSGNEVFSIYRLVDRDGCESVINQDVNIQVDFVPVADAGADFSECSNTATLAASVTSDSYGQWFYEPAPGYISDPNSPTSDFTVPLHLQKRMEEFELMWRLTNNNNHQCYSEDIVKLTLYEEPKSEIITDISQVYFATHLDLEAKEITSGMEGQWEFVESPSTESYFENPNSNDAKVKDLAIGTYTFKWTVSNGEHCPTPTDQITIVNEDIYRTTGFSPNGDGINDRFIIGGAENVKQNKLVVFNISGEVVYEVDNFCHPKPGEEIGWDGIQKNGEKKDGTYYYIFTGENEDSEAIKPIKNYLIIKGSKE